MHAILLSTAHTCMQVSAPHHVTLPFSDASLTTERALRDTFVEEIGRYHPEFAALYQSVMRHDDIFFSSPFLSGDETGRSGTATPPTLRNTSTTTGIPVPSYELSPPSLPPPPGAAEAS